MVPLSRVERHQHHVKRIPLQHLLEDDGVMMPRDADISHDTLFLCLPERFQPAAWCGQTPDVFRRADVVYDPQVQVVGAQAFQTAFQFLPSTVVIPTVALGAQKDRLSSPVQGFADDLFAFVVAGGGIDVADACLQRRVDDACGLCLMVFVFQCFRAA